MGKHNGSFGKQYGKVVGKDDDERPGWTGERVKKAAAAPTKKEKLKKAPRVVEEEKEDVVLEPMVSLPLQQQLLNIFRDTFPEVLTSENLQPLLQDVKAALFARDFGRAFGKEEFLEAYSTRWSPSRSLCYASILVELREHLAGVFPACGNGKGSAVSQDEVGKNLVESTSENSMKAVCFGGGAAEVIAFAGFLRVLHNTLPPASVATDETSATEALQALSLSTEKKPEIDLMLVDSAQWQSVVNKLQEGILALPILPKYSNAAARAANAPLLKPGDISTRFRQEDVLALTQIQVAELVAERKLLTLLFTLNELYTSSMKQTTAFLLHITMAAKSGTLLLVVDSPGSYSEVAVGSEAKKYPMQLLLDHTLLGSRKPGEPVSSSASWVKIVSKEAQWFRLAAELNYTIPLENMRYQLHLFRRV